MTIKSLCNLRTLCLGPTISSRPSHQSYTTSHRSFDVQAKISKQAPCVIRKPVHSFNTTPHSTSVYLVFRRTYATYRALSDFTPDEYVNFQSRRKNYIIILLGMQDLLRKLSPEKELPQEVEPETWEYFLTVLDQNKKLFIGLPSITRNSPADWINDDFRDILRTIPKYIYQLEPLPIFHDKNYHGKLYETIEDKFWGQMEFAAPANASYELLEEDHQIVCEKSAERIRSGETLIDICSWNGELLLPTALKAQEAGKTIEIMGVNLTKEGLILTRLSAQAVKLDQRISLGLGNVIYPLILPKRPKVIMNTRVLPSLTGVRGEAFIQNNLFPLLQEKGSVAFLSVSLQEGENYQEKEDYYRTHARLPVENREFDKQPVYLEPQKKHQIGVSYFQKDPRFNNSFRLIHTYYSVPGLHMLMNLGGIKIRKEMPVTCKARQENGKDSKRLVVELESNK